LLSISNIVVIFFNFEKKKTLEESWTKNQDTPIAAARRNIEGNVALIVEKHGSGETVIKSWKAMVESCSKMELLVFNNPDNRKRYCEMFINHSDGAMKVYRLLPCILYMLLFFL
jgi:hypothetical protein